MFNCQDHQRICDDAGMWLIKNWWKSWDWRWVNWDHSSLVIKSRQSDLSKLETWNGKNDSSPRKINTILLNMKINLPKLVSICEYKLAPNWQNFTEIHLAWVKILQKVLGGYFFWTHTVDGSRMERLASPAGEGCLHNWNIQLKQLKAACQYDQALRTLHHYWESNSAQQCEDSETSLTYVSVATVS